jgi:hypothetical protein
MLMVRPYSSKVVFGERWQFRSAERAASDLKGNSAQAEGAVAGSDSFRLLWLEAIHKRIDRAHNEEVDHKSEAGQQKGKKLASLLVDALVRTSRVIQCQCQPVRRQRPVSAYARSARAGAFQLWDVPETPRLSFD